ncbi:hypothetical protein ACFFX0_15925 [Citricoccus parietis]|uniref:Uncharacterized protein n=1 Tax=Citricoccus parietis TaxID=592307 RepID=A0ABV5G0Z6_9MICC
MTLRPAESADMPDIRKVEEPTSSPKFSAVRSSTVISVVEPAAGYSPAVSGSATREVSSGTVEAMAKSESGLQVPSPSASEGRWTPTELTTWAYASFTPSTSCRGPGSEEVPATSAMEVMASNVSPDPEDGPTTKSALE